jgi:hypothetical protein
VCLTTTHERHAPGGILPSYRGAGFALEYGKKPGRFTVRDERGSLMGAGRKPEKLGCKPLLTIVAVTAMLAASVPFQVSAEELHDTAVGTCDTAGTATAGETPAKGDVATAGGPTLRVEDPVTGQIAPLPSGMEESVSTSEEGLVETPDAGGGTKIDLQGRFRSYLKVTRDEAGQVSASCSHGEKH